MSDAGQDGSVEYDSNEKRTRGDAGQPSITDLLGEPLTQAYLKAIVAVYALLGAGMGAIVIANDVVDEAIVEVDGNGFGLGEAFVSADLVTIPVSGAPYVAALLAVLVGGYVAVRMVADDRQALVTSAVGGLAGTVVLWLLSAVLAASQLDDTSVDFGGLLINAVVLGILVGAIAAGVTYVMRNMVPDVR